MKLNLEKLEKQKKLALTLFGTMLTVIFLWYFGVHGLHEKQTRDSKKLDQLKREIVEQHCAILTEKNNREDAKAYVIFIDALEKEMPHGNSETWLVQELSGLAAQNKLLIANTIVQPINELSEFKFKDQPYKLEGLHLEFKGELNQIGRFLENLENSMPLMEVDDLSITAGSDLAPHIHNVSMRISMVTKS